MKKWMWRAAVSTTGAVVITVAVAAAAIADSQWN
jgi:hypothetical protein